MSLRNTQHRWSNEHGFGSINRLQFTKCYYVVRFARTTAGLTEHHCNASNLRIAKKKADRCRRGEL